MDTERQWSRPDHGTADDRPTTPGWQPPRPRLPLRPVVGIVVLLAVLLAVSRLTDLRLWPSLPNPFASREVDRSRPVLLKSIEDLKVYKAASGNFQVLVDLEESARGIPLVIKGERTLFVAAGSGDPERPGRRRRAEHPGDAAEHAPLAGLPRRHRDVPGSSDLTRRRSRRPRMAALALETARRRAHAK